MPRIRIEQEELEQREIKGTLKKYMEIRGVTPDKLIQGIGISRAGYYSRIKDPNQWRLRELRTAYRFLAVPQEERIQI